jgi:hypothetical protein
MGTAAAKNGGGKKKEREEADEEEAERGYKSDRFGFMDETFIAPLTAGESTKVEESDGAGIARFVYDEQNDELLYRFAYRGDLDITQIHIHHAEPGEVDNRLTVFLRKYTENTDGTGGGSPVTPQLGTSGSVNNPDALVNEDPEVADGSDDIDDVVQAILEDPDAFQINTHTTRSPGGEIRGQIRGLPVK